MDSMDYTHLWDTFIKIVPASRIKHSAQQYITCVTREWCSSCIMWPLIEDTVTSLNTVVPGHTQIEHWCLPTFDLASSTGHNLFLPTTVLFQPPPCTTPSATASPSPLTTHNHDGTHPPQHRPTTTLWWNIMAHGDDTYLVTIYRWVSSPPPPPSFTRKAGPHHCSWHGNYTTSVTHR